MWAERAVWTGPVVGGVCGPQNPALWAEPPVDGAAPWGLHHKLLQELAIPEQVQGEAVRGPLLALGPGSGVSCNAKVAAARGGRGARAHVVQAAAVLVGGVGGRPRDLQGEGVSCSPFLPISRFSHKAPPSGPRHPLRLRPPTTLTADLLAAPCAPGPGPRRLLPLLEMPALAPCLLQATPIVPSPRGSLDLTRGPPGCVPVATRLI